MRLIVGRHHQRFANLSPRSDPSKSICGESHAKSVTQTSREIGVPTTQNSRPGIEVALPFREEISLRDDPILEHFDLVHTAKRKQELH
jgi:hypothetical protein